MSVLIETATLVVRKTTLDAAYPGGADAFVHWLSEDAQGARWVVSDPHLVAASFMNDELDRVRKALINKGLVLHDEHESGGYVYEEVAIVDSLFGLAEHCDWLEWDRPTRKPFSICWLAGTDPGELAVPPGHDPGAGTPLEEYPRWVPGVMRLAVEPPTEIWLDTSTSYIHRKPIQPMFETPGPIMEPIYRQLPHQWTVENVRLTEGDAEELHADVSCGGYPCEMRIRAYEHQQHFEALLYWPIDIPEEHRADIEARFAHIRQWRFDPVRGCPTAIFVVLVDELPDDDMAKTIVNIMITEMLQLQTGIEKLAEEEEFTWLRPLLGLEPKAGAGAQARRLSPSTRHALAAPMDVNKKRKQRDR